MTRVWLTCWEWECCGEAFAVGDEIDFGIASRITDAYLADMLGPELVATVDAIESHHEEEFPDRVRGRVLAVQAVTREVIERRSLCRPGHGAPPDAVMPGDGEDWPVIGRELGNGVFVGTQPSRYIIEIGPVPDTAALVPVEGVRLPSAERDAALPAAAEQPDEPPPQRRARSFAGWLVDVEEVSG